MKIASVTVTQRGGLDALLSEITSCLQAQGVALTGIVRDMDYTSGFENGCDTKVRVLPDGPVIKITQDLGAGSGACRLDPGAIAQAVAYVENAAPGAADLFILNKFGPEEAEGRGFCNAIADALERDIPVLVGVGAANKAAFDSFSGGLAIALEPRPEAIFEWFGVTAPA